jgi:hypothetical protein
MLIDMNYPFGRQRISRMSPIVIGGCARSGTTLLLSVLSCHPNVYAIPVETQALCPTAYDAEPRSDASFDVAAIQRHLNGGNVVIDCQYWCEKTPRNVMFFSRILKCFGAKLRILHVVRDGRDVVCSVHPSAPDRYWVEPKRWVKEVETGLVLDGHPQVMTVRYEDLVLCYHETVQAILGFLSLQHVPEMDDYPMNAKVVSDNAWFEPARAISAGSVGRWRNPMQRERVDCLLAEPGACRLLSRLNYDMGGG